MFTRFVLGIENAEEVLEHLNLFLFNQKLFIIKDGLSYSHEPEKIITLNITKERNRFIFYRLIWTPKSISKYLFVLSKLYLLQVHITRRVVLFSKC